MNPMGIFGGTFDPIHYAHLRTAFELQQALRLKEIRFLPAGNPPHRDQPFASAQLRLKMVELGPRIRWRRWESCGMSILTGACASSWAWTPF
jgi:nicotinate-nucleotide adenylyltransferase